MTDTHDHLNRQLDDADEALRRFAQLINSGDPHPYLDDWGALEDWAHDIISETGRPYTVELGESGGARIELVADGRWPARLVGHWMAATAERSGAHLDVVMDHFVDRRSD
ncbi:hypothetical protein MUG78_17360 [Gordonia alkaliphila]|uniref:hypothetical protein n=1 Tax=Gordonia alkaliphila TaxID=1053547 RepID=UPI001FF624DE|nr:hypothetical protein [Gordonia alkaliphila]MCK0441170.1 hypothetical protein [Gordonia alkaliphila]